MKLSFKSVLGAVPKGPRSVTEIVAAGVTVKKEARTTLSTSDKKEPFRAKDPFHKCLRTDWS